MITDARIDELLNALHVDYTYTISSHDDTALGFILDTMRVLEDYKKLRHEIENKENNYE